MNQKPFGYRQPTPDLSTPEEKALWEQVRAGLSDKRKAALPRQRPASGCLAL
jgi:hypothetical protein